MKKILNLTLITLLVITALGCKKETPEKSIQGTWELSQVNGGQIPGAEPIKKGNGNLYKFEGESYTKYVNGEIVASGTFSLEIAAKEINGTYKANRIIKFSPSGEKYHIYLSAKKLIIFDGVISTDGIEVTYEKK